MKMSYWLCSLSSTNNDHSKTQGCKVALVEDETEGWRGVVGGFLVDFFKPISFFYRLIVLFL